MTSKVDGLVSIRAWTSSSPELWRNASHSNEDFVSLVCSSHEDGSQQHVPTYVALCASVQCSYQHDLCILQSFLLHYSDRRILHNSFAIKLHWSSRYLSEAQLSLRPCGSGSRPSFSKDGGPQVVDVAGPNRGAEMRQAQHEILDATRCG